MKKSRRRDVFVVHPFDAYAGSQRVVQHVRSALIRLGHRCQVHLGFGSSGFVSNIPEVSRFLPIDNIPWRKRLYIFWIIALTPRILWAVIRGEIVWANSVHAIPAVLPALLLAPRRVVLHIHEIEFPAILYALVRWASLKGALLLSVSDLHRRELKLAADVLYNCYDNQSETVVKSAPVLIFVGAISRLKGFDLFVEVVSSIEPGTVHAIAFVPKVPNSGCDLVEAARKAGIELRIGVTDPTAIYPGASLLLQCTNPMLATETFSLVMVEALSFGVPVGTAGMKVADEILGDAWAFDVPDRVPHHIASHVIDLFSNPERLQRLSLAAIKRSTRFTFPIFCKRINYLMTTLEGKDS